MMKIVHEGCSLVIVDVVQSEDLVFVEKWCSVTVVWCIFNSADCFLLCYVQFICVLFE